MQLFKFTIVFTYCAGALAAARVANNGTAKGTVSVQPSSESSASSTKVEASTAKPSTTVVKVTSRTTKESSSNTNPSTNHVSSKSTGTTTKAKTSKETQVESTFVASEGQPSSATTPKQTGQTSITSNSIASSSSTSGTSSDVNSLPESASGSQAASLESRTTLRPDLTSSSSESHSTPALESTPATDALSGRPQSTAASSAATDTAKPSSYTQQTPSNTMSPQGSSQPTNETATGLRGGPRHCLPGSQCAWKLGVGLSFGSIFTIAGFCVISRRYRRFLAASQVSHREKWHRRGSSEEEDYQTVGYGGGLKMKSMSPAGTPPPQYGRSDELFLPDDVQRIVNRVSEVQLQHHRLPPEIYGSVERKPLLAYRDF
ncbi:hypothetical protein LTR70_009566 [Exophiala xenobiotica]|uniref:Uncharacterized protein n=1 Tax=Lithohypha guttulata TaxID=1690604 RepID=A0ABR0KJB4_9EURO|nr:hypothetical protein LTR24_001887 [Lithohypha guttulata]KAK5310316.1 hypothetical protein LTR70_009566 [Exophiala xenobiotica]